jgi:hypothetical protein
MRFTYRLVHDGSGFVAECLESDVAGAGTTEDLAIDALLMALEERMFRPDAVAPPSEPAPANIELVRAG